MKIWIILYLKKNKTKITARIAQKLLNELDNYFKPDCPDCSKKILDDVKESDIISTKFIKEFSPELLPWKLTWRCFLRQLLNLNIPRKPFRELTFFCGTWVK